ncbi:arsenate reductase (glutaredoxin) [Paracoccus nototheniae]|uniref:arsenate reductase (glutaredoxin) n=1 Tax=Paracoccus nototheniae TaxID=2489002 RepID=UPI001040B66E|nr:arsenate reductase (glutaredoxin) [Paracoccus nototheniae]
MGGYVIWHKPTCSTSRFVLAALRDAGVDPVVRDYVADPPSAAELRAALADLGLTARGLLRRKGTPFDDLGLGDPALSEDDLIAAMAAHPLLIERPVVFAPAGAVLCRPKERVHDLLP